MARRCRIDFASRGRRPGIPEISRASKLLIIGAAKLLPVTSFVEW
jgi:hypothetical protein